MGEIKNQLKNQIQEIIRDKFNFDIEQNIISFEKPKEESWGNFSTNLSFKISKDLKQSPSDIAKVICYELWKLYDSESDTKNTPIFSEIYFANNGFINFRFSNSYLAKSCKDVILLGNKYGSSDFGEDKLIIVEYSAPNPNKPLHIGHTRNDFIGSSLAEILEHLGYKVLKTNYINDIGTHICKSLLMYQKYGNGSEPDIKPDHFVGNFYKMFEKEEEKNPKVLEEAQELLKKWEAGDKETIELWKKLTNWVYSGWDQTYKNENVSFDVWKYGSEYSLKGKEIAEYALSKGLAFKDESGAIIANLEEIGLPNKVLLRSDGTSIYSTQDLQMAKDSYEEYSFEKRLYVVDNRQADYFKQIFKILELLGFEWSKNLVNIAYGYITLPDGAMSSRKGRVVNSDDVYQTLIKLETEEIKNSNRDIEDLEDTVKKIALAAFRYGMLKVDIYQDMVFDYQKVSKFDGNTGPYLLYSYARAKSILTKSEVLIDDLKNLNILADLELSTETNLLISQIINFSDVVLEAGKNYSPNTICNYLFDLSQKFNNFYSNVPILKLQDKQAKMTLLLVSLAFSQVLKNGLNLLKIDVVEKM